MQHYIHKVHYHETDKMGITHHSNYIKWMEESRIHYLDQIGFGYAKLENEGVVSPVIAIECQYKHPTTFDDEIDINAEVDEFNGVKLTIKYLMTNKKTNTIVFCGKSTHCFLDKNNKPLILKKQLPELDETLKKLIIKKEV